MTDPPPPARSPRQGLLGGVLITLTAEGIALPAGVITAAVLTRGLGPELYGRFVVVASTVAIIEWLLIAVLARAVVKFVAEADDWRPVAATSFRLYLFAGVGIAAAVWVSAGAIAAALRDPLLAGDFRFFAPQIPVFAVGAACRNVLAGQARYRQQAMASAVGWICRVTFIVALVWMGYGITGAILGSIGGTLAGSVTALALVGGGVWGRAGFPVRQLLQLALPAFLSLLCARLLDQVGIWMLKASQVGEDAVGYYAAGMNVTLVTSVIAAAVTPVLLSTLTTALHRGDHGQVRDVSRGAVRFGLALLPFGAVVAGSAPELVRLLFGADYSPAAPMLAMLTIASLARASVVVAGAVFIALNRAWTAALLMAPLPFVAVAVHLVVIPTYGAVGVATVTMTLTLVAMAASVIAAWKVVGVSPPVGTLLRSAALFAAAYALAVVWPTSGALVVAKVVVISLGVLCGFVVSGELSRVEIAVLGHTLLAGRSGRPGRT